MLLPARLTASQVGDVCRMSSTSATAMLRDAGIAEHDERGRWYVKTSRLRASLPDVYQRVYEHFVVKP